MRIIGIKLLLLLIVLGVAAPMFIHGPDRESIMQLDDWVPHRLIGWSENLVDGLTSWSNSLSNKEAFAENPSVKMSLTEAPLQTLVGAGTAIYTWRDSKGVLHFSDTPVDEAGVMHIPDDGLAIPADKFVQSGLAPAEPSAAEARGRAYLLKEPSFSGRNNSGIDSGMDSGMDNRSKANAKSAKQADLADIEALANGDLSKLGTVLKELPQLLEQAKQAQQKTSID